MSSPYQALPSVEMLTKELHSICDLSRPVLTRFIQDQLHLWRERIGAGEVVTREGIVAAISQELCHFEKSRLQPVINATGVIIHTNLGRSPLGDQAAAELTKIVAGYSNLELDLVSGERGPRAGYLEAALASLLGAPRATLVNNCAAALVLVLRNLSRSEKNEVIVSRGELVEIGGGFRVPDILASSGCLLREVGTTNKTHLRDYEAALSEKTALILKVHRSNFYLGGFTQEPAVPELAALAHEHDIALVEDLGSGALMNTEELAPLEHEPTPMESLQSGVDLVTFSGDKLLGGPQSGIIAGRADLIEAIKKEPFFRALRCDKLILATLQVAIEDYLGKKEQRGEGGDDAVSIESPTNLAMLSASPESLMARGEAILAALSDEVRQGLRLVSSTARTGGGTMPKSEIPSLALQVKPRQNRSLSSLAQAFRLHQNPVMGYTHEEALHFDLRTVRVEEDALLCQALQKILS